MVARTGRARGRPKGAKNKRTSDRESAMNQAAERITKSVEGAFEGDALAFLMSIYKDPAKPDSLRIDAAKSAIRYERPPLAPIAPAEKTEVIPLAERLTCYEREEAVERTKAELRSIFSDALD